MVNREDFKREFKDLIVKTVLAHGTPVATDASEYGWVDHEAVNHIKGAQGYRSVLAGLTPPTPCVWVPSEETDFSEEHVYEYGDTLNGSEKTFITITQVSCACKTYENRSVRYEGRTANFIPLMFMEESQFDGGRPSYYS